MSSELDASETESSGQKLIHLNIKSPAGVKLSIVLDPTKDYAALSSTVSSGSSCVLQKYSNYVSKNGKWIPTTILIERYSDCQKAEKPFSYDYWTFNHISTEKPNGISNAVYENDTLIEYRTNSAEKPLFCQHSSLIDDRDLLYKKLSALNNPNKYGQNCATSALKYVIESLGTNISDSNLAAVINTADGGTSLLAMQQFVNNAGLQSLAVRIDVRILNNPANYKAILYLPWEKHYVVFSHIENDNLWVIDLANNWLCYSLPLEKFDSADTKANAVVLFISNKAINIQSTHTAIPQKELAQIIGAAGSEFGKYSCTELIQEYDIEFCQPSPIPLIPCWGRYTVWYNRYGCKEDENGGECTGTGLVGSLFSPCGEDPYYPGSCDITGEWYAKYIRACQ
jgi:predicted double-glycine peptidase